MKVWRSNHLLRCDASNGSGVEALPDGETYQYGDYVMSNTMSQIPASVHRTRTSDHHPVAADVAFASVVDGDPLEGSRTKPISLLSVVPLLAPQHGAYRLNTRVRRNE
jgi:hypothetical protein